MAELHYKDLGCLGFLEALSWQERLLELKQRECTADILLLVEHPHVYTLGRGGKESNVLAPQDVPVHRPVAAATSLITDRVNWWSIRLSISDRSCVRMCTVT